MISRIRAASALPVIALAVAFWWLAEWFSWMADGLAHGAEQIAGMRKA